MAYAPHIKMTASGTLGAQTRERWQFSINFSAPSVSSLDSVTDAVNEEWFTDIRNDVGLFIIDTESRISSRVHHDMVKFALIGADGNYADEKVIVLPANATGTASAGSGGGAHVLPQNSLAITLDTAQFGPSGRGRFYMPMPVVPLDDSLLVTLSHAEGIRGACATFLNNLNNKPGLDAAFSPAVVVASSKGYNSEVTSVRVGRVVDTVSKRRRQLNENYTASLPVS